MKLPQASVKDIETEGQGKVFLLVPGSPTYSTRYANAS